MVSPLVVCHQPRSPENLASIARVMANFGCDRLIVSDPQTHEFRSAGRLAVKADAVLDGVSVAATLDEALASTVYAVGSTSRAQLKRFAGLTPEDAAARLARHSARGPVALVLGGEKRGLSDEELARCHDVVVIATDARQPSMNLSHAAAVLLYACSKAEVPSAQHSEPGADRALVNDLEQALQRVLLQAEFLNPQAPTHVLGELMRSLVKNELTVRQAHLWRSAMEHLERHLQR